MRGLLLPVLAMIAGCGRVGFSSRVDDAGGEVDAADAGPCDRTAPYASPVPVPGVSTGARFEATMRLSTDELRGYLWTDGGGVDLSFAVRPTPNDAFVLSPITELNTPTSNEFEPSPGRDELVIVFNSNRAGGPGGLDLYLSQRADTASTWSQPVPVPGIDTAADEHQPFLTDDALYFVSDAAGDPDLYRAPRISRASFGAAARIEELSRSGTVEADPVVSFDGLTMYFASDRATAGDLDIYVATRSSALAPWGAITRLPDLSSTVTDGPSWESVDGCRLYLSSAKLGTPDVYVAKRAR